VAGMACFNVIDSKTLVETVTQLKPSTFTWFFTYHYIILLVLVKSNGYVWLDIGRGCLTVCFSLRDCTVTRMIQSNYSSSVFLCFTWMVDIVQSTLWNSKWIHAHLMRRTRKQVCERTGLHLMSVEMNCTEAITDQT
jgi:hypothetical protein